VKVTVLCYLQKDFEQFFTTQAELSSACKNVESLMAAMNIRYNPEERRLFIHSSMHSLKAVLLQKRKVLCSVPVACNFCKERNIKEILSCVNYMTSQWHIRGGLKSNVIVKGLQQSYTKFCRFLSKWDSLAKSLHYSKNCTYTWNKEFS
jgi:hypothetical protein